MRNDARLEIPTGQLAESRAYKRSLADLIFIASQGDFGYR
jgi:hypothetical protein